MRLRVTVARLYRLRHLNLHACRCILSFIASSPQCLLDRLLVDLHSTTARELLLNFGHCRGRIRLNDFNQCGSMFCAQLWRSTAFGHRLCPPWVNLQPKIVLVFVNTLLDHAAVSLHLAARSIAAMDFLARLAALVPKPRMNLTRFLGVFQRQVRAQRVHLLGWQHRRLGLHAGQDEPHLLYRKHLPHATARRDSARPSMIAGDARHAGQRAGIHRSGGFGMDSGARRNDGVCYREASSRRCFSRMSMLLRISGSSKGQKPSSKPRCTGARL